jgi:hypothetical protein
MRNEPPKEHRWKPGESGNPNGRPKGSRNRSTIVREWLDAKDKVKNPITGEVEEMTVEDMLTLAVIVKARKGDVSAYKALLDSAYGQAKQEVESTGSSEVITRIRFTDD